MAIPVANAGGAVVAGKLKTYAELAEGDLGAEVQLAGSADPGDGASIASWLWEVQSPPGATDSFDDATLQNPKLTVDGTWGDRLVFLKATNNLGTSSETKWRRAPDSAFAIVRVRSATLEITKPAEGARYWTAEGALHAAKLEELKNELDDHTIASHDTTATGAELDTLTGGGNADALHTHAGLTAPATTTTLGLVKLAEAAADPANPKAVTRERFTYAASFMGDIEVVSAGAPSWAQAAFSAREAATIAGWSINLRDVGSVAGDGYTFTIYEMTPTQYEENDYAAATTVGLIVLGKPGVDNRPRAVDTDWSGLGKSIAADKVYAVRCTTAPAGTKGQDMQIQMHVWIQR